MHTVKSNFAIPGHKEDQLVLLCPTALINSHVMSSRFTHTCRFVVMQKHRAETTHSSTISRPHDKTWTQDSKSSTPRICMLPWAFRWWPTAHHQGPPRTAAIGPHSVPQEIELWLNYVVSDRSVLQNESWFQVCFNCEIGLNSPLICTTTSSEAKSVGLGPCMSL